MINYNTAIGIINDSSNSLPSLNVSIEKAPGMVSFANVTSPAIVPPFNNSAMDGFAVIASEVTDVPVTLNVEGSTAAGDAQSPHPNPLPQGEGIYGKAWEIMTGAPVPKAYDAVVRVEDVDIIRCNDESCPTEISVKTVATIKQNIRNAGEDFNIGDAVLKSGDIINSEHIMALATLGISDVEVIQKPSITVISTGKELVDDMSQPLKPGQIRNSNAPYLLASLAQAGIDAKYAGTIHDEVDVFEEKIKTILDSDTNIIISTGAVSMGRYDFIPDSLRKLGAEILFHKVAIRPGKPILFAKFPNGVFYFGLPGNPVSAAVGLRFFVQPLLKKLQGLQAEQPILAKLSASTKKKQGFLFFRKAYAYSDSYGQLHVDILDGQESFKIHSMLKANCWAVLPEDASEINVREIIEIYPLTLNTLSIFNKQIERSYEQQLSDAG